MIHSTPIVCLRFGLSLAIVLAAAIPRVDGSTPSPRQILVVHAPQLQAGLQDWLEFREHEGYQITTFEAVGTARDIQHDISTKMSKAPHTWAAILLVGDAGDRQAGYLPTHYRQSRVNYRFGSTKWIATDLPYADIDDDDLPDVPLGRLAVGDVASVRNTLQKVIRYERSLDVDKSPTGPDQPRLQIFAGEGGFGAMIDQTIETMAKRIFEQSLPEDAAVRLVRSHELNSLAARGKVFDRLQRSNPAWIYLGHGTPNAIHSLTTSRRVIPLLTTAELELNQQLPNRNMPGNHSATSAPLGVLIACLTGAHDLESDCLAQQLLVHQGGPVASIAATRVTMPYGNTVFGLTLLRGYYNRSSQTIGELLLYAQRKTVATTDPDDALRTSIDQIARGLSPLPKLLAEERQEHQQMYHLFGDPLMSLPNREVPATTRLAGDSGETFVR